MKISNQKPWDGTFIDAANDDTLILEAFENGIVVNSTLMIRGDKVPKMPSPFTITKSAMEVMRSFNKTTSLTDALVTTKKVAKGNPLLESLSASVSSKNVIEDDVPFQDVCTPIIKFDKLALIKSLELVC